MDARQLYNCVLCMKSFTSWANFKRHGKEVHESNGKFMCSRCTFKTNRNETLMRHMQSKHQGFLIAKSVIDDLLSEVVQINDEVSCGVATSILETVLSDVVAGSNNPDQFQMEASDLVYQETDYVKDRNERVASILAEFRRLYPTFQEEVRGLRSVKQVKKRPKAIRSQVIQRKSKRIMDRLQPSVTGEGDGYPECAELTMGCPGDSLANDTIENNLDNQSVEMPEENSDLLKDHGLSNYVCLPCQVSFRDSTALKRHVGLVHEVRSQALPCPRTWCSREFFVFAELKTHRDCCFLVCSDCGKKYTRESRFHGHLRFHAKEKERMI